MRGVRTGFGMWLRPRHGSLVLGKPKAGGRQGNRPRDLIPAAEIMFGTRNADWGHGKSMGTGSDLGPLGLAVCPWSMPLTSLSLSSCLWGGSTNPQSQSKDVSVALKPQSPGHIPAGGLHSTQLSWVLGPMSVTLISSSLDHGRTVH